MLAEILENKTTVPDFDSMIMTVRNQTKAQETAEIVMGKSREKVVHVGRVQADGPCWACMKKGHFWRQCTKDMGVLFCKICRVKGSHVEGSWLCPNYKSERRSRQNSGASSSGRAVNRSQSPSSKIWSENDRRRCEDRPKYKEGVRM